MKSGYCSKVFNEAVNSTSFHLNPKLLAPSVSRMAKGYNEVNNLKRVLHLIEFRYVPHEIASRNLRRFSIGIWEIFYKW